MAMDPMPITHQEVLEEALLDPEFRQEYQALGPRYDLIASIIGLRAGAGLTQEQLAERLGVKQSFIARLESKPVNLTLKTLIRVIGALDADLEIHLVPAGEKPPTIVKVPARYLVKSRLLDRLE